MTKSNLLRSVYVLLLGAFALTATPTFASDIASPSAVATMLPQMAASSVAGHEVKIEKKKGFFGKMKAFGQKTKSFFKGIGAWAAGGDHNVAVAIILAFFLGGFGIHRVYLGGRGILILLYIITLGGIFGILPLIDFIRLIIGDMDHYEDNDSFFAAFQ